MFKLTFDTFQVFNGTAAALNSTTTHKLGNVLSAKKTFQSSSVLQDMSKKCTLPNETLSVEFALNYLKMRDA